jgi:hypothetical protein
MTGTGSAARSLKIVWPRSTQGTMVSAFNVFSALIFAPTQKYFSDALRRITARSPSVARPP